MDEIAAPSGQEASMRPPHSAGENFDLFHEGRKLAIASMRPPHSAGENGREFNPTEVANHMLQ